MVTGACSRTVGAAAHAPKANILQRLQGRKLAEALWQSRQLVLIELQRLHGHELAEALWQRQAGAIANALVIAVSTATGIAIGGDRGTTGARHYYYLYY